jgi:hypothetical protein
MHQHSTWQFVTFPKLCLVCGVTQTKRLGIQKPAELHGSLGAVHDFHITSLNLDANLETLGNNIHHSSKAGRHTYITSVGLYALTSSHLNTSYDQAHLND